MYLTALFENSKVFYEDLVYFLPFRYSMAEDELDAYWAEISQASYA
jgi:hypothetical protein